MIKDWEKEKKKIGIRAGAGGKKKFKFTLWTFNFFADPTISTSSISDIRFRVANLTITCPMKKCVVFVLHCETNRHHVSVDSYFLYTIPRQLSIHPYTWFKEVFKRCFVHITLFLYACSCREFTINWFISRHKYTFEFRALSLLVLTGWL